jgi:phosphopantothenoylcysteine decarboxylase / phosphopantothenate---cysteine ligase
VAETLRGRTVVLGVSGSIAAYKAAVIVRRLREQGAEVCVVMTPAAARFVTPLTFRALSQQPVVADMWAPDVPWEEPHVALGARADLLLVAPATANMVARLAAGFGDDPVSATALATRAPIVVAPAMSDAMAQSPAVQENLERLRARGVRVLGPVHGRLASGRVGPGRMTEPEAIVEAVAAILGGER